MINYTRMVWYPTNIDPMKKLELFGLVIVTLISTAFLTTPVFFTGVPILTRIEIVCMLVPLVIIAVATALRIFFNRPQLPDAILFGLAVALYLTSSIVFFTNEAYFLHGTTLPLSFWHRVSFYTLPAITLESALVTMFGYFITHATRFTDGERTGISYLFYGYTIITMIVNFMVIINLGITVSDHLLIAKTISVGAALVAIGASIKKCKLK